eukprot:1547659-Pyramimonas_sp.AAC.1
MGFRQAPRKLPGGRRSAHNDPRVISSPFAALPSNSFRHHIAPKCFHDGWGSTWHPAVAEKSEGAAGAS